MEHRFYPNMTIRRGLQCKILSQYSVSQYFIPTFVIPLSKICMHVTICHGSQCKILSQCNFISIQYNSMPWNTDFIPMWQYAVEFNVGFYLNILYPNIFSQYLLSQCLLSQYFITKSVWVWQYAIDLNFRFYPKAILSQYNVTICRWTQILSQCDNTPWNST